MGEDSQSPRTCRNCGKRWECPRYSYFPCEEHKTDSEQAKIRAALIEVFLKGELDDNDA